MSLLSHNEISLLLDDGVITKAKYEHINSASLDIQLGPKILSERLLPKGAVYEEGMLNRVVLKDRTPLNMMEFDMNIDGPYILYPGEFILAHSVEIFHLPNHISAKYILKSSMARIGLEHLNAGWCDAGWHGSVLTLELKNMTRNHEIVLQPYDLIGQLTFFSHTEVPHKVSYASRGRYNNDRSVSGSRLSKKSINFGDSSEDTMAEEFEKSHPSIKVEEYIPNGLIVIGDE